MGKRTLATTSNRQGNLNEFLDIGDGGTHAPRKRQAYASKRLQQVVTDFRKKRVREPSISASSDESEEDKPAEKLAAKTKVADAKSRRNPVRRGRTRASR